MRIACVDKTATDRLKLEQLLEDGFRECRRTIGHLLVAKFYPSSKEEALVNSPPNILVVGPAFSVDEALTFVRDWKALHPQVPIFVFTSEEDYSLRVLKRFEPYVAEVFCQADKASRYVFSITSVTDPSKGHNRGKLVVVQGVKGGVGVTSLVGGLAHAYQDMGKSVVVVDLSKGGVFSQFMLSDKWLSAEFSEMIAEGLVPDADRVERLLVVLKNGLQVLPSPSGAGEIRELYVRDSERLEVPLYIVDRLLELFDIVLVDTAGTEGILTFALSCRADCRLVVSGNDTGSVHLLGSMISEFQGHQEGQTKIVINKLVSKGLNREDVLDFVSWNPHFDQEMLFDIEIPYEERASMWIGTGNTIFTEGSKKIKNALVALATISVGSADKISTTKRITLRNTFGIFASKKKLELPHDRREALPMLPPDIHSDKRVDIDNSIGDGGAYGDDDSQLSYSPPKRVVNE
jgi:cellulose biosynthesis protein BcsQ